VSRKIGTSVALTTDQMDWLDEQDDSISAQVRECIQYYRDNHE